MILDLQKIWNILNFITEQEYLINKRDIYPNLLGLNSNYYKQDFNHFLEHYSFSIRNNEICIFNDDQVHYEDFTNSDFSYIPVYLLDCNKDKIKEWIDNELKSHLISEEENKEREKENLKNQIKILTERLEKL